MFIISIPVVLLTAYAALTDIKRGEIDNWVSVAVLAYGILIDLILDRKRLLISLDSTLIIFVALGLIYYIARGSLGGGDVKLFSALAFYFGNDILLLIYVACVVGLVYGLIKGIREKTYLKTKTVFAPAIFAATVLTIPFLRF
jgi:Flp pilus assembly protein protease CpaA